VESRDWRTARAVALDRDNNTCQSCRQPVPAGDLDVHHLVPRAAGGGDESSNLITLCDGCHAARHPNLQGGLARRMIERWGLRLAKWLDQQHQLGDLDESLSQALRLIGVTQFRGAQLDVVLAALRRESVLLVSATGSGKSLCFQLPILLSHGTGVIISPLKALMSQQVSSLTEKQVPATFINSDLAPQEKVIRYELLQQGAFKFLLCTPERFDPDLVRPDEIEQLSRIRPSFLVIDEAHCVDRWGGDFRPNYGRLAAVRKRLGDPPVLAFTATAGRESQRRILESLGVPNARVIVTGVDRPNIALARFQELDENARLQMIDRLLDAAPDGRAMIFVPTVKVGDEVQAGLRKLGRELEFYHSRIGPANERDMLLGRFTGRIDPPMKAVICTNAFGMGLDVPDVRLVVHWQHPASVEDFLQEFGRAGRDGRPAVAVLFTSAKDVGLLHYMSEKTVEQAGLEGELKERTLQTKYALIDLMRNAATAKRCFRNDIVNYFGGRTAAERPTLSLRIVRFVFARREPVPESRYCCDFCDRVTADNAVTWATQVLSGAQPRTRLNALVALTSRAGSYLAPPETSRARKIAVALAAGTIAAFGWILTLPSKAECVASGRVVDPTLRHCESPEGWVQLQEHALFHAQEVGLGAVVLLAVGYAVRRIVRHRASNGAPAV